MHTWKPGKLLSNRTLISFVLLLYLVVIVIHGFWVVIDAITAYETKEVTVINGSPTVVTTIVCTSDYINVWVTVIIVYEIAFWVLPCNSYSQYTAQKLSTRPVYHFLCYSIVQTVFVVPLYIWLLENPYILLNYILVSVALCLVVIYILFLHPLIPVFKNLYQCV